MEQETSNGECCVTHLLNDNNICVISKRGMRCDIIEVFISLEVIFRYYPFNKHMKRAMSNPYSHRRMIIGELHMAYEK